MLGMAFVTLLVVLMSYGCCMGLGGYFSAFTEQRNNELKRSSSRKAQQRWAGLKLAIRLGGAPEE